ncbi:MAG: 16S rRNA (cytosine(967)-C(5))-methyltransferase RsmB [Methylophilaceae bacterium]|nr:16S rRNA (cytosine(967)-C(5))-methyltransferase RsmB [Methyloradius sp.]
MQVAQSLAANVVSHVLAGKNLTVALDEIFRQNQEITPQQRAVTQDLSYGTLRFYGELRALLNELLETPLQDQYLRCLLLVAIYQINHDQAAPHTIVDQAVNAAIKARKSWAKGLVNGVLRNYLRQREVLQQKITADETAKYSYPQWWINKLKKQYPEDWQAILLAGNQHPPMTLRVNQRKTNINDYSNLLSQLGIEAQVLDIHAIVLGKPTSVERVPGFATGEVSVQDFGAQQAAKLLDLQDGMHVLDACCAPGGKTGHILELATVNLLAIDSDQIRLQRTQSNLTRLGLQAELKVGDAAMPDTWWDGTPFDRILADVPCTASGIVRRHVDIKWLRREADIASFSKQQAQILPALWRLLAKGGKLLYVTCSIFNEENQSQIDRFLEKHADARQLPLEFESSQSATAEQNIKFHHGQLLPCAQHDGFFYALLQKI